MERQSSQKNRIIKDCIHRLISVPSLCQKFLDVPEFQRLRRIKQLGNVHRVYPCANHTRFEHSIGVMHLSGKLCDHLGVDSRTKELIQLAGLYHDIGHMPYSHLFDRILEIINPPNIIIKHEDRSIHIFEQVCNKYSHLNIITLEERTFVKRCIKGEIPDGCDKSYLYQIITSAVDVDRLDYLSRDAYHTGMPSFQSDYIIESTKISSDGFLAYNRKAYMDISNMFDLRERMHKLVYQHNVSLEYDRIYICMIMKIFDEINNKDIYKLDDFKLESILMDHHKTSEIYIQIEHRHKNHDVICGDPSHPECKMHIPKTKSVNDLIWID